MHKTIIEYLTVNTIYRQIHILPYHKAAEGKYNLLKRENKTKNLKVPDKASVETLKKRFESNGFKVYIGG